MIGKFAEHGDAVAVLIGLVEADTHTSGWDQPPALYAIRDTTIHGGQQHYDRYRVGPDIRYRQLAATPCVPAQLLLPSPPERLAALASVYRDIAQDLAVEAHTAGMAYAISHAIGGPGLLGLALMVECWGEKSSPDAWDAIAAGQRIADRPGGYELRIVVTTDSDQTIGVTRRRGHTPESGGAHRGRLVSALRIVTLAALAASETTTG